jgi:hypothetical protein
VNNSHTGSTTFLLANIRTQTHDKWMPVTVTVGPQLALGAANDTVHTQVTCLIRGSTALCVTFTGSRWKADKWSIFAQEYRSHDVASICKRLVSVKYTAACGGGGGGSTKKQGSPVLPPARVSLQSPTDRH